MATEKSKLFEKHNYESVANSALNSEAVERGSSTGNVVDANKSIDAKPAPPAGVQGNVGKYFPQPIVPNGNAGVGGEKMVNSGAKKIDQEQRSQSSGSAGTGSVKKKRRHRRARRKRYKPYHKLTCDEKRELEQREERRAEKFRAERFAHGHAMAPYNTTQFLLDDREARNLEPDVDTLVAESLQHRESRERTYSGTASFDSEGPGTSDTGSSAGISDSFSFEREFEAEYESAYAERLEGMSKETLAREYVCLEQELDKSRVEGKQLRDLVNRLRQQNARLLTKLRNCGLLPRPSSAPVSVGRRATTGDISTSVPENKTVIQFTDAGV